MQVLQRLGAKPPKHPHKLHLWIKGTFSRYKVYVDFVGQWAESIKVKKIVGSCSGNFTLPPAESATSVIDVTLFENGEQSQYTY